MLHKIAYALIFFAIEFIALRIMQYYIIRNKRFDMTVRDLERLYVQHGIREYHFRYIIDLKFFAVGQSYSVWAQGYKLKDGKIIFLHSEGEEFKKTWNISQIEDFVVVGLGKIRLEQ